jgi:hypothetical protein
MNHNKMVWLKGRIAHYWKWCVINRMPSKSVPKTPYELWTGRKPSINYLHIWGYPAEVKIFNSQLGKLDPKTISCHFIGYPDKYKAYRFYCPECTTKCVDTRHAMFLECDMSSSPWDIDLEEFWTYDSEPITHVGTRPFTENDDPLAKNWGVEPAINENEGAPLENEPVGLEENEPVGLDHEEEPQQGNDDESQPTRR